MSDTVYYVLTALLTLGVLLGIALMSKVRTASLGNLISAVCMAAAILITLYKNDLLSDAGLWIAMAVGLGLGGWGAYKVKMIQMPQTVALLNGFGGAASAIVGVMELLNPSIPGAFSSATAALAVAVGMLTLTGSLIAAAKLQGLMGQRPTVWPMHAVLTAGSILLAAVTIVFLALDISTPLMALLCLLLSGFFGVAFAIRVGGADMPITISLLNSFSGVAAGIAGLAISDPLLVSIGGVVGASGLLLTQIMCRAMNRHLADILFGKASKPKPAAAPVEPIKAEDVVDLAAALRNVIRNTQEPAEGEPIELELEEEADPIAWLKDAKRVIVVPGYGMALAQAQTHVKELSDVLTGRGAAVKFAIHPVAGRMPGHMNVLLAEVDVPYDDLYEMDDINPEFANSDVCVVVGANDVINPAANTAEGTPIYGMPVLSVEHARHLIICNFDRKPGYAGVENPLYYRDSVKLLLGDAKDSLQQLLEGLKNG